MEIQTNEQKKKMLKAFCIMLSAPVFALGIWAAVISLLVSHGSMLGLILIIGGALVVYALSLIAAKLLSDMVLRFFHNISDIAGGTAVLDASGLPTQMERNGKVNELMQSVNGMAVAYARVIQSIESATGELGEVSESFNHLFEDMTQAEESVSGHVNTISSNIISQAEKMQLLNTQIDDVSAEIEHISASIEALTGSAGNMKECNGSVESCISDLIKLNNENSQSIEKVREQTELTNKSAMNIRTATEIIASISNQTNLLALNASIEAARAGEAGKGFAVVAEEIRKLADQSRESTEQINESVNELVNNAQFSVEVTQKVTTAFAEQTDVIHSTSDLFGTLRTEVIQVTGAIAEIEGEINNLNTNKDSMRTEVKELADFSESNEESAKTTLENVYSFERIISDCRAATERILRVSSELVQNIDKVAGHLK